MEHGNQTSDVDSDEEQNIDSFTKLKNHLKIDTDNENEVISISQASNHKQREKLARLLKRYTENKEELIRNAIDLYKVSSILRRDKCQMICFEEYSKLDRHQNICKIINTKNRVDISLPREINTMKKLSKYSVEELEYLSIHITSNCKNEHEDIEEFLLSFGSTRIEKVTFSGHISQIKDENYDSEDECSDYYKVYPCSSYFYGFRDVISKAIKCIWIYKILLSSKEFSVILRAAKRVKRLHFSNCKILTDYEHELGEMEGCKIDILSVDYSIHVFKNSRDYDDSCMKMFLSIVGCTNLLCSLRYLQFKCEREMREKLLFEAKEMLGNDYDMLMPWFECL